MAKRNKALEAQIGQRIRLARQLAGVSQTQLARAIGISFQQIQKYESAHNRVSSSTLWKIAVFLQQPVVFFFPSADEDKPAKPHEQLARLNNLDAAQAVRVLEALDEKNAKNRRLLIDLISIL